MLPGPFDAFLPAIQQRGEDFLDQNEAEADKPLRFDLFKSVAEFRPAELSDVWTGPLADLPDRRSRSVEAWVREDRKEYFYRVLERLRIQKIRDPTSFANSVIFDVELNGPQMETPIRATGAVIEFCPSAHFVAEYRAADKVARRGIATTVAARIAAALSSRRER